MPEDWKYEPNKWLNTIDIDKVMEQYEKYDDDLYILEHTLLMLKIVQLVKKFVR